MSKGKEALDAIRRHVWEGMEEEDAIFEIVNEGYFEPGEIDPVWLRTEIETAFNRKLKEEESWPEITDCDRLDAVFDGFWEQGILALQNAGANQDQGLDDALHFYCENGGKESSFIGYCYYTSGDLERVVSSNELYLTYGHMNGDDEPGMEIGRRIQRKFEEAGFTVEWDGSIQTRLFIKGIRWLRRST